MRSPSLMPRAIATVAVATSVVALVLTSASPALGQTAPAASLGPSAAPSTEGSVSPSASAGACTTSSASTPARALVASRVQVGDPVAPRWFASDGQSLWVHEPTSLVRLDMATSAITGQVPMYVDYGYDASGEGAVWQTDFGHDALLRIDPVAAKLVTSIPLGSDTAPEGV